MTSLATWRKWVALVGESTPLTVRRGDLEALLDEVERLQRENAELRESRDLAHELLRAK